MLTLCSVTLYPTLTLLLYKCTTKKVRGDSPSSMTPTTTSTSNSEVTNCVYVWYLQFRFRLSDFDDDSCFVVGFSTTTDRFPNNWLWTSGSCSCRRMADGFLRRYLCCCCDCIRRGGGFTLSLTRTYRYPCACCWPWRADGGGLLWSRMQWLVRCPRSRSGRSRRLLLLLM